MPDLRNRKASSALTGPIHPRRVLVCVTGLTPQVVTETTYALVTRNPAWVPTEVHVLTTVTGAELARRMLLGGGEGHFCRLRDDFDLNGIDFDDAHIHVLCDSSGKALDDIRSHADNMAIADAILAKVAAFAADPKAALHVSLAGGRKSMGFFAGYALSLYGRTQDRLSHVLVSQGFETNPDFFYPPPVPAILRGRNGDELSTADAHIELADIPIVRLRDRMPEGLLNGGRFADAVAAAQRMEDPHLRVVVATRSLDCGGTTVKLSPVNFAIYAWHARRAMDLESPLVPLAEFNKIGSTLRRELHEFGRGLYPNPMSSDAEKWDTCPWADDRVDCNQWMSERRTRTNETIRRALGRTGERVYGIDSVVSRGRAASHRLALAAEAMEFVQ